MLVGVGLITLSILTGAFVFRFGTPLLLVLLFIDLVVGGDELGMQFDNAELAHFLGSFSLAVILFDSGFSIRVQTLTRASTPSCWHNRRFPDDGSCRWGRTLFFFDLPWLYELLMDTKVCSTDAATVVFLPPRDMSFKL